MTLFEVGISLLIVAVTCTTVLLLFPVGLKAQQESRYRIVAASQAQLLVQGMLERQEHITFGSEGTEVYDRPYVSPTAMAPDLDGGLNIGRFSAMAPLPPDILQRIDSDRDEMARLVAEGSQVFYSTADNSDMKLVFAVSGYPQQNALLYHPQIKWPYHDYYPTGFVDSAWHGFSNEEIPAPNYGWWPGWRGVLDTEVGVMYRLHNTDALRSAFEPDYQCNNVDGLRRALDKLGLDFETTVDPEQLGLPVPSQSELHLEYTDITADPHPRYDPTSPLYDPVNPDYNHDPALRFNARAILLRYYAYACGVAAGTAGRSESWPHLTTFPDPIPAVAAFQVADAWMHAYVEYLHLRQPYDLRTPRNYLTAAMVDCPLFQFDTTTALRDPAGVRAPQALVFAWDVLSSRPIVAVHANTHWNTIAPGDRTAAAKPGWNLTDAFDPSARCREVVAWAVDWQSYEDFESVPGSPIDCGLVPRLPNENRGTDWAGVPMKRVAYHYAQEHFHPEFPFAWTSSAHQQTVVGANAPPNTYYINGCAGGTWSMEVNTLSGYLIRNGADRDRNGVFDRGPVRNSVRMRASTIARFLAYDPRLYLQMR
ncbi:MAG: hypothetical protein H0W72_00820 [Planctomycetes bacterium]|nr:hypothetical protein [Planctomycetota bacterium]